MLKVRVPRLPLTFFFFFLFFFLYFYIPHTFAPAINLKSRLPRKVERVEFSPFLFSYGNISHDQVNQSHLIIIIIDYYHY